MNAKRSCPFLAPLLGLALLLGAALAPAPASAQDLPPQRQIRTYIPPDQLVSFLPSTPFDRFVDFLNPIFSRVTGKQVIDPDSRAEPIGISIAGMHFLDALELVLQYKGLQYRETDRYFMIEVMPEDPRLVLDADAAAGRGDLGGPLATIVLPATLGTREIQIHAVLFELNHTRARDIGLDWSVFLGSADGGSSGGSSGGSGGSEGGEGGPSFFLKTDELFKPLNDAIISPNVINLSDINSFLRLAEQEGAGETVANPSISVQSGEQGRIQIGTDVPVQVRDFAGNTVTQFFSTGIIVDVTPTLIEEALIDTLNAPTLEFIHLNVRVEKSGSTPSVSGPVIDRNSANTQVLLLDGEQTVIGGLYTTDESVSRSGVPVLKDLPGWFFGLRYLFGRTQRQVSQKELLIVLQAHIIEPLQRRASRPFREDLLQQRRDQIKENIRRFSEPVSRDVAEPQKYNEDGSQRR